jgi:hypothetical protein
MNDFHLSSPYSDWWYHTLAEPGSACTLWFDCTRPEGMGVSCEDGNAHCRPEADQSRAAARERRNVVGEGELDVISKMLHGREVCTRLPHSVRNCEVADEPDWKRYPDDRKAAMAKMGKQAIVAVIDDGIGFANEAFRNPDGSTRFDYVWLQGAARVDGAPGVGRTDLPFGRELERGDIDGLLREHHAGGLVDEEALYCEAGLIDRRSEQLQSATGRASHGTGVLYRAAGRLKDDPGAPILIAVSLPNQVTQDTTGLFLEYFVILAIQRILQRVQWLRQELGCQERNDFPVAINLSYSLTAGPMDGSTLIDRFVAATKEALHVTGPKLMLVVPAGNHRLSRTHARLKCGSDGWSQPLTWRVLPDDRTPSFVEIWSEDTVPWAEEGAPTIHCELTPPGGAPSRAEATRFKTYVDLDQFDGVPGARAYFSWHPQIDDPNEGRERIVLALLPTVADAPGLPSVPAGDWTIRIKGPKGAEADLHVQRDDTPLGYRLRGRQSYFDDGSYEVFDEAGRWLEEDDGQGLVTRRGTLNAIVSLSPIRMIGASSTLELRPMRYSGLGDPAEKGAGRRRPGPNTHRPAAASRVHEGVRVAGTLSGSAALRSGTSFAAPLDTRVKARMPQNWEIRAKAGDEDDDDWFDDGPERVITGREAVDVAPRKREGPTPPPPPKDWVGRVIAAAATPLAVFVILGTGAAMAPGVIVPLAVLAAILACSLAALPRRRAA